MGLWGVLLEIAKAMAPHAAPHVARAVVDAAKERRAANEAARTQRAEPSNDDLAGALDYLEQRLSAAEDRADVAEQKLALLQARLADQWVATRKWAVALIAWNALVTLALIVLIVLLARR
jgi:hypothetical protein